MSPWTIIYDITVQYKERWCDVYVGIEKSLQNLRR